jgi:uncharacterized protein (TIGR03435 family)
MKKKVWLTIALGAALAGTAHAQAAKDISGNWQGTLQAGNGLRTLLKITSDDGKYKAVMYSIDQGGQPIPVNTISIQGSAMTFAITGLDVKYAGTLNPDGNTISGSATQHGETHTLNLTHVSDENAWAVPEPPKPMAADAKPKFDVVTVKPSDPNRPGKLFTIRGRHVLTINTTVNDLVTFAYGLNVKEIVDGPLWFETDKFDVDGVPDVEGQPSLQQMKDLVQDVLATRFNLKFHHDQRVLAVYVLTVGKNGPKMTVTADKPSDHRNFLFRGLGKLGVTNNTMKDFCDGMQGAVMDKPVVDHTGLTDRYDFNLTWTPDETQFAQMGARVPPPTGDDPTAPPSLYTAVQEQLGLKLEAGKAATDVIVIDHVEKPSAN